MNELLRYSLVAAFGNEHAINLIVDKLTDRAYVSDNRNTSKALRINDAKRRTFPSRRQDHYICF
ncbi:hypothetical protein LDDCCGHA_5039 [Methylobacterium oxalidis]|nr:hypothetical protein LDDCCGHA_5039 [Methylobacterium oxalidis]